MSSDIHALSGAYAVDALDDAERAEFEKHLAGCEACRAEVDDLREAAATLAGTVVPPASLRARVLAEISTVRPLAPRSGRPARIAAGRRRWAAAAVAAAVVVLAAGGIWHPWTGPSPQRAAVSALDRIILAPDAQRTQQTLADDATVVLYRSPSLDQAAIVTDDLPAPPAGKVYELWLQDAKGALRPAGLLPDHPDAGLVLDGPAAAARGVGITAEPSGGSQAPTSAPIALIAFPDA